MVTIYNFLSKIKKFNYEKIELEKSNTLKLSLMERDYQAQINQLKEKQRNELQEAKLIITEDIESKYQNMIVELKKAHKEEVI